MSVSELHLALANLSSAKITERKKSCEVLFHLLKQKTVVAALDSPDTEDHWDTVFRTILLNLNREIGRVEELGAQGTKPAYTMIDQISRCNDLLVSVVKVANRKEGQIDFNVIFQAFKRCIKRPLHRSYTVNRFLLIFRQYLLSKRHYWGTIEQKQWIELFDIFKCLHEEDEDSKALVCLQQVVKYGLNHNLSLTYVKSQYKLVEEICQSVKKTSPAWLQETVLELFLDFCQQNVKNSRRFCCALGEEVLNNLLLLYEPYSTHSKIKFALLRVVLFQVRIHHPKGATDGQTDGDAYAASSSTWARCLRRLCRTVGEVIEARDKDLLEATETGKRLHPVFAELAVEVYKQQSCGAVAVSQDSSKRKCVEFNLSTIVDNAETTREWAWIDLLANVLRKYPGLIDVVCFKRALTFLSNYLTDCKVSDTRSHIFDCLSALVQSEPAVTSNPTNDDLDPLWSLVWDSALRSIGLNENQSQTHNLIQSLIASNKKQRQSQLASTFASRAISLSSISLATLNVLGGHGGLNSSSNEAKKILIRWVLSSENDSVFASRVTAEVLVNLTLKQWPQTKEKREAEVESCEELFRLCEVNGDLFEDKRPIVAEKETSKQTNAEVFEVLLEFLTELSSKLLRQNGNSANILPRFVLLTNTLNIFMDFEVEDGEDKLVLLLDRLLETLWDVLRNFIEDNNVYNKKTEAVYDLILRLFEADVRHFVKDKMPVDLLQIAFGLLAEDCEEGEVEEEEARFDEDPRVRLKLRIVEVIVGYCVHARDDTQRHALKALVNFSIDASNPVDYSQAMIILKSLRVSKDDLTFVLKPVCLMLKKICDVRYREFDVALDILDVIHSLIPFAVEDGEVKENLTHLLMPFYQLRNNYGPEVAVKVANCIGKIIDVDLELSLSDWWSEEEELALVLPTLLLSDQSEVRFAAARNLIGLFSRKDDKLVTPIYQCQKTVFQHICQTFAQVFEDIGEDEDETVNRTASVLYTLAVVITSSSLLRQKALFELFYLTHIHKLQLGKVDKILQKIAKRLNLDEPRVLLENHLGYLLHRWNAHRLSLKDFPVFLFRCQSDAVFYDRYICHILPILFNEEDTSVFETICQKIGKTVEEIIEDAYPKILAKNLVTAALKASADFEVSPEDLSLTQNIQERIRAYLAEDNCQQIVLKRLDDVVVQLFQFVFDLEHFREVFEVNYALPEPETTFLTVRLFEDALELLRKKLDRDEDNFMRFLTSKRLNHTQLILLKLTRNVHRSTTFEDKILNFHRYSLYLNLLVPHLSSKFKLSRFIVRDVTHNLMNLTRSAHPLLPLLSSKLFLSLVKAFVPHAFDNFLIEVASALVPIAQTSTSASVEALKILKILIEDTSLREELRILDPLPEGENFQELRRLHFEVKGNEDLRGVIQGFLRGGVRCRIEGLRYLRRELVARRPELKTIYQELHKSRGALNEDSVLHLLVCDLVRLTTSQNKTESVEAARCLGELGSSDLTTMVLRTEGGLGQLSGTAAQVGTSRIVKLLVDYLVDEDNEVACASSEALHAVFGATDERALLKENMMPEVDYLVPFLCPGKPEASKFSVDKTAFVSMLSDEALWCPEAETEHRKWIALLVSRILGCIVDPGWYRALVPLCNVKISFAEQLLPVLVNVLIDVNSAAFQLFSGAVARFFARHWELRETGNRKCIVLQRPSVKTMLDVVHFVRVQRNVPTKTNRKRLELDLDYLQVALAAQFCGAHFSTLMYAELWCQKVAPDIRKSQPLTGSSVLELIREHRPENKALQEILRQAYINIGDGDALHTGQPIDPLDPPTQVNAYADLNRWDLVLHHYDVHGACGASAAHRRALANSSLLDLSTRILPEPQFESLWRLGRWTLPPSKTPRTFEARNYYALKAFKENDSCLFEEVEAARDDITTSLRHASLESCRNLYEAATRLQCLQELEEFEFGADFEKIFAGWEEKDSINPNEFRYFERVLSHRIAILSILIGQGDHPDNKRPIANRVSLVKALVSTHLNLSRLARLEGNLNVAKRAVDDLLRLELEEAVKCEIVLENSQIFWQIDKKSGMQVLRGLLKRGVEDAGLLSRALSLYGTWLVETKTESTKTIISDYFLKSIKLLQNSRKSAQMFEATDRLARFADEEYQEILSYTKSAIFAAKVKNAQKLRESAAKLKQNPENLQQVDIKRAILVYERQSDIDTKEIENTVAEKETYLKLALKHYLGNLRRSDVADVAVFRVVSLLLHNKLDPILLSEAPNLLLLPTHKILPVLPQLVPHLSPHDDPFSLNISKLVERTALDHPHHALPLILAVANSHKDDINSTTVEPRVEGAKALMNRVRSRLPDGLVQNLELVADALIQLAYYESPKGQQKSLVIPKGFKLRTVRRLQNVLVPTYNLPIRKNADYKDIVGIHRFLEDFSYVGGANAPKLIRCLGTDGRTYDQLVKGKDDLRQDAVMQQVFNIMNGLLGSSKTTSNLLIRTYKILPLSKRSGILEWVDNTMPFGDYLVGKKGAHTVFNAGDISPEACCLEFRKLRDRPYDRKLAQYLRICEKFRPAFHHFFERTFLQPTEWYERRRSYTQSVATTSMCGYVLGLGDRHVNNILVDKNSAEVIHIDFGIAFEQGKVLPTPETVPFRLTRDVEDGMGVSGVEGTFRRSCEKTMTVLRENSNTILTILEVLLYDPLYAWTITPSQAYSRQLDLEDPSSQRMTFSNEDTSQVNLTAERALGRLRQKLQGTEFEGFSSVEGQVGRLIQQARDPANLCRLYCGWRPYL